MRRLEAEPRQVMRRHELGVLAPEAVRQSVISARSLRRVERQQAVQKLQGSGRGGCGARASVVCCVMYKRRGEADGSSGGGDGCVLMRDSAVHAMIGRKIACGW